MENNNNKTSTDMDAKRVKRIAIIPARCGSKGLLNKNVKPLNGKPMLLYSVEAAINSHSFDTVFVSTDSREYAKIAEKAGADCHFLRSTKNSSDNASSWDTVREVIYRFEEEGKKFDEIMLLQPTSPLRNCEDILASIKLMCEKRALAVDSVTEMDHSPLWSNTLPSDGNMRGFFTEYSNLPRQFLPKYYRENGAIYLVKRELIDKPDSEIFLHRAYAYIMPRERSIDIDVELDFKIAELLMEKE